MDRAAFKGTRFPWYLAGLVAIGPDVEFGETERESKKETENGPELPNSIERRLLIEDSLKLVHKVLAENLQTLEKLDFHEYGEGCSFNTTYIVPYNFRHTLSRALRKTTVIGRTGRIQLDKHGSRVLDPASLGIYNFVGTNPKVVKAGKWNGGKLEFETDLRFYSDFQRKQRTLRIGIIRDEPFVFYDYLDRGERSCKSRDLQNTPSSSTCYSGIIISLLKELCRNLDFHCTYHESVDGTSGVNQNG